MKQGWELKTLGEVCEFSPKKRTAKETLDEGALVSFAPMENLCTGSRSLEPTNERTLASVYSNYTYFANGDVLLAKITPCFENGKLGVASDLMNGVGFGSSEFMVIRPSTNVLPEYIYYFLDRNTFRQWARQRMTGAVGHKRVPKELVANLEVPLPPLDEQKRIVALLDEAFAGLETARTNAEANLKNAEELFVSTLDNLFSLRANKCEYVPLERHVEFVDYRGKTPTKSTSGIRLITAKNVKMGKINMEPREFMPHDLYDGWMTRGIPEEGDVLFTTEAPLANVAQLDTNEPVVIGQRLITMKPDNSVLLSNYLKFVLMSPAVQKDIRNNGTGATVVGIKASLLKKIKIPLASSIEEQRKLGAKAEESFSGLEQLRTDFAFKVTELSNLRQSLLQKAFAGELT